MLEILKYLSVPEYTINAIYYKYTINYRLYYRLYFKYLTF